MTKIKVTKSTTGAWLDIFGPRGGVILNRLISDDEVRALRDACDNALNQQPQRCFVALYDQPDGDERVVGYYAYFATIEDAEDGFERAFGDNPNYKLVAIAQIVKQGEAQ